MKNKDKFVDTSNFDVVRREITVDGQKLPLSIGDQIKMSPNDHLVKTVMGVQINEDCRINYCLEWYDETDGSFKSEWLTMSELKLLKKNALKRKTISLNG